MKSLQSEGAALSVRVSGARFPRLNCGSRMSTSRVAQARLDRCPNGVFGTTTCWQPFYHEAMRRTSAICWRACSPASWHCPNHWLSPGCAPCSRHCGQETAILERRHALCQRARSANPERWRSDPELGAGRPGGPASPASFGDRRCSSDATTTLTLTAGIICYLSTRNRP